MKTNFPSVWQEMLEKAGFDSLTDIQQQAFEPIFTGKDLLESVQLEQERP